MNLKHCFLYKIIYLAYSLNNIQKLYADDVQDCMSYCKRIIIVKRGVGMRIQQMILGMMLLLPFGASQADEEARHFMSIYSDTYSDDDLSATSYQYGYDFSNFLSLELNYSSPEVETASTALTDVSSLASIMIRFNRRYESINIYFMLGGSSVSYTDISAADETYSGVTYGVGIELYGSKNTAVSFTWSTTEFDDASAITELDITKIGLVHHFDFSKTRSRY